MEAKKCTVQNKQTIFEKNILQMVNKTQENTR